MRNRDTSYEPAADARAGIAALPRNVKTKGVQEMKITMVKDRNFYKSVLSIMLPVALQQAINMGVNCVYSPDR